MSFPTRCRPPMQYYGNALNNSDFRHAYKLNITTIQLVNN